MKKGFDEAMQNKCHADATANALKAIKDAANKRKREVKAAAPAVWPGGSSTHSGAPG